MLRSACFLLALLFMTGVANADWQLYKEEGNVIASYDFLSFSPFKGNPSVWVRWEYVSPENGIGGKKIQFTANCTDTKLFAIAVVPFDTSGEFLTMDEQYNSPEEYPLIGNPLNKATYKLLCR
ncbi:MAG: hypothetical protein PHD01_16180 [Geobacteraceae bacterium]|nr:hypothetical protein [Geobacteraceae bacterium]